MTNREAFSGIEIKSIEEDKRELMGWATTPASDRVNDVVEPTGLTFQTEAPLLWQHDHTAPVGTVKFGKATAKGLPFTAKIAKPITAGTLKSRCDEAWDSVKYGVVKGVSIGFRPLEAAPLANGGTRYTKADVHELSLVTIPCNPEATITAFKGIQSNNRGAVMNHAEIDQIRKALAQRNVIEDIPTARKTASEALDTAKTLAPVIAKAAVPPMGSTGALVYPAQMPGVLTLHAQVTRSLIAMLGDLGAPAMPANKRILTQPVNLTGVEIGEEGYHPGSAPASAVMLSGMRKFGLLVAFSDEMLALASDEVIAWVNSVLENAANNAVDAAVIAALQAGAGTAQTSVNAAFDAFTADLRTACWVGSPDTLGKLRSAQERDVSPRGGMYYGLPALPVLAAPSHTLFLLDAARTPVFDGPRLIERSNESLVVLDSAPDGTQTPVNLFQEHMTALKITKWADFHLATPPVAVTVA